MDDVIGFAEEGLVDAMNTYNPNKGQSFKSYAAYRILYFIQNGSNSQGHTVKFSAYMQKKKMRAKKKMRSQMKMRLRKLPILIFPKFANLRAIGRLIQNSP